MTVALGLARRGLGSVWPNPSVGCVIVRDGRVVGRGWTQPGGRPHAESEALRRAGGRARGAATYVSLEPCAHVGETPSCADALVSAGISRAVVAIADPDPRVNGEGTARLVAAGIEVVNDVCRAEAEVVNAGFLSRLTTGRPLVTLKLAVTLDGRIAGGKVRWITGEEARARAHLLRAEYDAVMVGIDTALADDPRLDCRLPGMADRSPVAVVADSSLRLPVGCQLLSGARNAPVWLVTLESGDEKRRDEMRARGVELLDVSPGADGRPDLASALRLMAGRGLTRLLVEGGARLAAALIRERLVDRLVLFRAPKILGREGTLAVAELGLANLDALSGFRRLAVAEIGDDLMETYVALN